MGYDRYSRRDREDSWSGRNDRDDGRDYGYGGDYGRSSARDYAAAGEYGRNREQERGRSDYYGSQGYGGQGNRDYGRDQNRYGGRGWDRDQERGFGGGSRGGGWDEARRGGSGRGDERRPEGYNYQDRDFLSRAGDEVRSWFGDDDAERRREQDARYDAQHGHDDHYRGWRSRQIADLDRDYDEYRRENATRFENEFSNWRNERQTQRSCLGRVTEHMEVIGSDGQHVGTVDKVRGDRIVLTKNDADAGGHHHSIPSRWIDSVDDKVTIRKTADEAKAAWKDEERSGAMFGEQGDRSGNRYLNRSFSGTY